MVYILVEKKGCPSTRFRDLGMFAVTFFTYNQVFTARVEYGESDEIGHLTVRIE